MERGASLSGVALRLPARRPRDARAGARALGAGEARAATASKPVIPPVLVRERALFGTGFLPDTEQQIYSLPEDELYLVGTSEVALASLHDGEILDAEQLPLRYAGFSPVLPARGRRGRQGHARDLPRAPVRQGRDVQLRRARGLGRRARADPRDRGGDPRRARAALPGREHRRRRPRQLGGQEVRLRGVAAQPGALPRADLVLEHDRLPGPAPEHPAAAAPGGGRTARRCTRSTAPPWRSGARSSRCSRTASAPDGSVAAARAPCCGASARRRRATRQCAKTRQLDRCQARSSARGRSSAETDPGDDGRCPSRAAAADRRCAWSSTLGRLERRLSRGVRRSRSVPAGGVRGGRALAHRHGDRAPTTRSLAGSTRSRRGSSRSSAFLEDEPALGRLLVVALDERRRTGAAPSRGGPRAARRRRRPRSPCGPAPAGSSRPPVVAEGVVGAVLAVLQNRLLARRRQERVIGPVRLAASSIVVLPYLGAGVARPRALRARRLASASAAWIGARRWRGSGERHAPSVRLTYRTAARPVRDRRLPRAPATARSADRAGIVDQGQISKLLSRLQARGLIIEDGRGPHAAARPTRGV